MSAITRSTIRAVLEDKPFVLSGGGVQHPMCVRGGTLYVFRGVESGFKAQWLPAHKQAFDLAKERNPWIVYINIDPLNSLEHTHLRTRCRSYTEQAAAIVRRCLAGVE